MNMPHKHKRRQKDEHTFDLPPTTIAKSLPVHKKQKKKDTKNAANKNQKPNQKSWKCAVEDDTPRAFARLMQYQRLGKLPSGLDDGKTTSKKRKRDATQEDGETKLSVTTKAPSKSAEKATNIAAIPKILPGEKLSDFAARVDQMLPLSSVKKSNKSGPSLELPKIREERMTKHEKHLRRLQQQWREEEARIREREDEEHEEYEAEHEEQLDLWKEWELEAGKQKAKKKKNGKPKKKRKKGNDTEDIVDDDADDDDPWAKLNARARATKPFNLLDVVQAPPQSLTKPREVFKMRRGAGVDIANVPAGAGSLRRREELAGERKSIVEEYRRLMAEKRQR